MRRRAALSITPEAASILSRTTPEILAKAAARVDATYRAGCIHREQPEPVDLDDTAYIEHLIDTSPDRELAKYAAAMQERLPAPPAP